MTREQYRIDYLRLVRDMTPAVLRKPRILAFLEALVGPVQDLHSRFMAVRRAVLEELPISPQVRILRFHLNERFDYLSRRIRILDGQVGGSVRLFTEAEDRPIYLPIFLSAQRIDFTVEVPTELRGFDALIRRFLDRYKLPTKTYRITYV
jgi:hypothetical protein